MKTNLKGLGKNVYKMPRKNDWNKKKQKNENKKTILKTPQMSHHFNCQGLNLQWCFKNVTKNV